MTTIQDKFFRELDALVEDTTRTERRARRQARGTAPAPPRRFPGGHVEPKPIPGAVAPADRPYWDPPGELEVVVAYHASNCGTAYLQRAGAFDPLSVFTFDFQTGYASFVVNGDRFHAVYGTPGPNHCTLAQVLDAILHPVRQDLE